MTKKYKKAKTPNKDVVHSSLGARPQILLIEPELRPPVMPSRYKTLADMVLVSEQDYSDLYTILRKLVSDVGIGRGLVESLSTICGVPTMHVRAKDLETEDIIDNYWDDHSANIMSGMSLEGLESLQLRVLTDLATTGDYFGVWAPNSGKVVSIYAEQVRSATWMPVRLDSITIAGQTYKDVTECRGVLVHEDTPIAYRVYPVAITGQASQITEKSVLVPASRMIRACTGRAAGSYRGTPLLQSVAHVIDDLDRMTNAKVSKVISTIYKSGFIERSEGSLPEVIAQEMINKYGATMSPHDRAIALENARKPETHIIKPGEIARLEAGETYKQVEDKYAGEDFASIVDVMVAIISMAIGIPAHVWYNKFADLNFSGSKAVGKDVQSTRDRYNKQLTNQIWIPLHRLCVQRGILQSKIKINNGSYKVDVRYTTRYVVDEAKEASAISSLMACGAKTLRQVIEERGEYYEDEIRVRSKDAKQMLEYSGITDPEQIKKLTLQYISTGKISLE